MNNRKRQMFWWIGLPWKIQIQRNEIILREHINFAEIPDRLQPTRQAIWASLLVYGAPHSQEQLNPWSGVISI